MSGALAGAPDAAAPIEPTGGGFRAFYGHIPSGARPRHDGRWLLQRATKVVLWLYMRLAHRYVFRYDPGLPRGRAYVAVMSHTSWLDVPALMVADPYDPPTAMVIKRETTRIPLLGWLLEQWEAVSVDRSGRDVAALRKIRRLLKEGRGICIAPTGTRSADGRLGPFSPVLVRLIAQIDAAVVPVAIVGTMESLPKGSLHLRFGKIYLDSGPEIDLSPFRGRRLTDDEVAEVARRIRAAMEALLPPYMHAAPDTPLLGAFHAD